jgi:hypothetical protein
MSAKLFFRKRFIVLLGLLGFIGCSNKGADRQLDATEERLLKVGQAYIKANYRLQRAPKNADEIKANWEGEFSDDVLRSPNDGEPFVILWGVDFATLPPGPKDPFTVGGYEKTGTGGKRYVLRFPIQVVPMTDDELRQAVFPPGHKAPQ